MKSNNTDVNAINIAFYNIMKNDLNLSDEAVKVIEDKISIEAQKEQNSLRSDMKEEFFKVKEEFYKVKEEFHKVNLNIESSKTETAKDNSAIRAEIDKVNSAIRVEMSANTRWIVGLLFLVALAVVGLYLK